MGCLCSTLPIPDHLNQIDALLTGKNYKKVQQRIEGLPSIHPKVFAIKLETGEIYLQWRQDVSMEGFHFTVLADISYYDFLIKNVNFNICGKIEALSTPGHFLVLHSGTEYETFHADCINKKFVNLKEKSIGSYINGGFGDYIVSANNNTIMIYNLVTETGFLTTYQLPRHAATKGYDSKIIKFYDDVLEITIFADLHEGKQRETFMFPDSYNVTFTNTSGKVVSPIQAISEFEKGNTEFGRALLNGPVKAYYKKGEIPFFDDLKAIEYSSKTLVTVNGGGIIWDKDKKEKIMAISLPNNTFYICHVQQDKSMNVQLYKN
jgi:hypothetical protein